MYESLSAMLRIDHFVFNRFYENTYVLWDDETLESLIIDPGMADKVQDGEVDDFIATNGLRLTAVANTHLHVDHVLGERHLTQSYGVPVFANPADTHVDDDDVARAKQLGYADRVPVPVKITNPICDGDVVLLGRHELKVISVPGHTPGSVAFYSEAHRFIIDGDTLLNGRLGMEHVDGADPAEMVPDIQKKIMVLPDETVVYPGHGLSTTIGHERRYNPYIRV